MRRFRKILKSRKLHWQTRAIFLVILISSFALVLSDALFRTPSAQSSGNDVRRVKIVKLPPAPYNSWNEFRKTKAAQHANTY